MGTILVPRARGASPVWTPPHEHIHRAQREGSHRLQDSLMECQGTQEEPEGRPGGPGDDKTARGTPP
jgi:hypothetical protein